MLNKNPLQITKKLTIFLPGRKVRPHRSIPIIASSLPAKRNPSRVLSPKAASSLGRGQNAKLKRRSRSQSEDDTLFDLDGFHENRNCEPFFESDDDSSGKFLDLFLNSCA